MVNRLSEAKSPYLLQHAENPVDWYEWGDEAFEAANRLDKPVFLSIGYSTCHWCHVMSHESFDNQEIARLMNQTFINIKVDREERPDIDNLYMSVCQMLGQNCGWPLTVIMTPGKEPFYVATYIPGEDAYGRPGMKNLVPAIGDAWQDRREDIKKTVNDIVSALKQNAERTPEGTLTLEDCHKAYQQLAASYDEEYSGFGTRPKFPSPHNLSFLLRYSALFSNNRAETIALNTLRSMRRGGIWDHVGFGFHRYSTDRFWFLPHFEKMLYDQATIMLALAEAYQKTGDSIFAETIQEISIYLKRDMLTGEGGYCSAEDADSEGEEGKFYVWSYEELQELLNPEELLLAVQLFGVTREGTYLEEATGEPTGANILFQKMNNSDIQERQGLTDEEIKTKQENIRRKLLAEREKRIRPELDDKVLTDWNGLLLTALAKSGFVIGDDALLDAAKTLADYLWKQMRSESGELLHRCRRGDVAISAFIDDYVFFAWGLLELFQATGEVRYLRQGQQLIEEAIDGFWDTECGGFYFSGNSGEELLIRSKQVYDGAIPSANSVAVEILVLLSRLTNNDRYSRLATQVVTSFAGHVRQHPAAYTQFLSGILTMYRGNREIVITSPDHEKLGSLLNKIRASYKPGTVIIPVVGDDSLRQLSRINEKLQSFQIEKEAALVYICENFHCNAPVSNPEELARLLI